jgi:transposase
MIMRHTGKRLTSHQVKRLTQEKLPLYFKDTATLFTAGHALQLIQQLKIQVEEIEEFVLSYCKQNTPFSIITSTPGIGKILGMTILLETGPIERFSQVGNYSSYARCVPTNKISNAKSKGKGNARNGNRYLAMAFVEAAHYATIWEPTIKRYYQRKCKRVPLMVAKKTIANKLTRACYHMLKNNTVFDIKRAFG